MSEVKSKRVKILLKIFFGALIWLGVSILTGGATSGITAAIVYWVFSFYNLRDDKK